MSRQKPDSILEMPVNPLLEAEPGQGNPFSAEEDVSGLQADSSRPGEEVVDPQTSPSNLDTNQLDLAVRRKKRFACSGRNHFSHFLTPVVIKKFNAMSMMPPRVNCF